MGVSPSEGEGEGEGEGTPPPPGVRPVRPWVARGDWESVPRRRRRMAGDGLLGTWEGGTDAGCLGSLALGGREDRRAAWGGAVAAAGLLWLGRGWRARGRAPECVLRCVLGYSPLRSPLVLTPSSTWGY